MVALEHLYFILGIPWKINMEPENHLFEKENHLPNLHFLGSMINFQGCIHIFVKISEGGSIFGTPLSRPGLEVPKLRAYERNYDSNKECQKATCLTTKQDLQTIQCWKPCKISILTIFEHKWTVMFLFHWVIFRFQLLILKCLNSPTKTNKVS